MGFHLLDFISVQCQTLTATVGPQIDDIGFRILFNLATIMLVWFGLQEAFASARGGPGFDMYRFLSFFILITFAYSFVKYYDSPIPGFDYSLKSYISQGTTALVHLIGQDSEWQMQHAIDLSLSKSGPGMRIFVEPYLVLLMASIKFASRSSLRSWSYPSPTEKSPQRPLVFLAPSSFRGWYSAKPNFCSGDGSKPT